MRTGRGTVFSDILNSFCRIATHCASAMVALMKRAERQDLIFIFTIPRSIPQTVRTTTSISRNTDRNMILKSGRPYAQHGAGRSRIRNSGSGNVDIPLPFYVFWRLRFRKYALGNSHDTFEYIAEILGIVISYRKAISYIFCLWTPEAHRLFMRYFFR